MESFDVTIILVLCILMLISFLWLYRPKELVGVPGPRPWPIVGNIRELNKLNNGSVRDKFMQEVNKKYGNICRIFMGTYPVVFAHGYECVTEILSRKGREFIARPSWLPGIQKVRKVTGGMSCLLAEGVGIIMESGEQWKVRRKFAMRTMRDFGVGKSSLEERILEEVENIAADLEKMKGTEVADIKRMMTSASCNVIHGIIFGFRYDYDVKALHDLLSHFEKIFSGQGFVNIMSVYPFLNMFYVDSLLRRRDGFKGLKTYIDQQIHEHRKSFDTDNIRDFVDYFLEAEQNTSESIATLDTNSLFNIIVDLFIAGTDTTANTLNWSILYMMEYQDVQRKCRDEILKVVGSGRRVRLSDRPSMPYVEAILMEIQRLANTVPLALPHVATVDTTIGQYTIPKNCIVFANIQSAHLDKDIWEKPEEFNPNRFLNEKMEIINKEYLIPFSMGPRVCLGESLAKSELFLIFSNLIQRFTFCKVDKMDVLSFEGVSGITRKAKPYKVSVTPITG